MPPTRDIIRTILVTGLLLVAPALARAQTGDVTLQWTAPGDDGVLGRATRYDLRYSLVPITATNFPLATVIPNVPPPAPAGSAESFKVTGLLPGLSYYFMLRTCDEAGNWSAVSNLAYAAARTTGVPGAAATIEFSSPRPNPAHGPVTFGYVLPHAAGVAVEVFDVFGRVIRRVAGGELPAGRGDLVWDLSDDHGTRVSPGVYLVRARLDGMRWTRRVVVDR